MLVLLLALCLGARTETTSASPATSSESRSSQQQIQDELIEGKRRLAQSVLSDHLLNRESVSVTPSFTWKLGTIKGTAASTFRSFNQSFILAGKVLFRLERGSDPSSYATRAVAEFPDFLGDVAFVESVEWDGLLLLLAAYEQGLLQVFTVSPDNEVILRQSIEVTGTPSDAEFFMQDDTLFCAVTARKGQSLVHAIRVYRWSGTHLDQEPFEHLEIEASAVSTFPFRESVVIVMGVGNAGSRKAGLVVFKRRASGIGFVDFVSTSEPSALQHFHFKGENYLLVTTAHGPSVIYWWDGTRMIKWSDFETEGNVQSIGIGYVRGETLILLAQQAKINIYRPTTSTLELVNVQEFPTAVKSASLYTRDDSIALLAITESAGTLMTHILELHITFLPPTASHRRVPRHPLLECFSNLEAGIKDRGHMVQNIIAQRRNLLHKGTSGQFLGKIVVKKVRLNNAHVRQFTLTPPVQVPIMPAFQLRNEIAESVQTVQKLVRNLGSVVFKSKPSTLSGRLTVDNLKIHNANMDSVVISTLNGQSFDPNNILMHSRNQKLTGLVSANLIASDTLLVNSLNHVNIEDLLTRQGNQVVSGVEQIHHVKANRVIINSQRPINGIPLKRIVTSKSPGVVSVAGTKTFAGLNLQQLAINLLNNVNFTNWINSLQPQVPVMPTIPSAPTSGVKNGNFFNGDIKIQDLTVEGSVNGVPINDLLSSLFLKGLNQHITGDVRYLSQLGVDDLEASRVNGVPVSSLLTLNTNQVVSGSLVVDSVSVPDIYANSVNGLKLSKDAAYVNSPFTISTPVHFDRLQAHDLLLPPNANISGLPIGTRLLNQPKIVYEGSVTVKGSLKLSEVNLEHAKVLLKGQPVDFRDLHVHYWTRDSPQEIPHSLHAPSGLNVKTINIKTINNVALENYVDLTSTNTLQGTWHFPSATIYGDLKHGLSAIQSPVQLRDLASNIVKTSGTYTISGSKIFLGGVTTDHLLSAFLDSKKVSDVFEKPDNQGSVYEEIWVGGDLIVRSDLHIGSVNGILLCDRLSRALLLDRPGFIPAATISAVSASNIDVKTFNGVPFNVIYGKGNGETVPRVGKVTIKGDVIVPAFVNVMEVNNKQLSPDYLSRVVDRTKSGAVRGKKTFASQLTVHGRFSALDYNAVKLEDIFINMLSKTRNQTISAPIWMKEMIAKELKATVVNNIEVNNLLSSDLMSRQTVEGDLLFTNDLDVSGHLTSGSFESGCDLRQVAERLQVLDGRHWASLTVEGSLNWERNLPLRVLGLGYYLQSAVTKNDQQAISGEVSFESPVQVNNFNSQRDVNDVAISYILTDSLRKTLPEQVIHGHKIFRSKLYANSMRVMDNVVAKTVAGVQISTFNSSLVRVDGNQNVGGKKRFLQGFSAKLLKVEGSVNGLLTSEVASFDAPLLPPINFVGPLEILGNMNFDRVNDISLDKLLLNRVTLDSPQQLEGHIIFSRDLNVEGDMVAPTINNLDIADLVQRDSINEQVIGGVKRFAQGLRVDGPVEVDYLEGLHLRTTHAAALFRDEDATIYGNLVFGNFVNMDADLNVETTVNGAKMATLASDLRSVTTRSLAQVYSIARTINNTNILLKARGDLSQMLYLEPVMNVPVSFTNTHKVVAVDIGYNQTYLDVYGWASNRICGLPKSCACPAQYSIYVNNDGVEHMEWSTGIRHNASERAFTFHLDNPSTTVVVKTNTISSSSTCRRHGIDRLDEVTMLTWAELDPSRDSRETTLHIEPTPILGYVVDVKAIQSQNRIYLVLGIGYNADLDTTDINSLIVRVDRSSGKALIVTEFPTHGLAALDVFSSSKGHHIVVGNSYDSGNQSPQVYLSVYRFETRTEQLTLVKNIPAEGVVSVSSVVQGGDSLVVVAQQQLYAPVMVLKYDSAHDDYHFMQQLNLNSVPTGLGVFYVGLPGESDAFLGVSTEDDLFYLYQFCHIEGFKLVMKLELKGVKGFSTFSIGSRQYLLFTSSNSPSVFEIVKQST